MKSYTILFIVSVITIGCKSNPNVEAKSMVKYNYYDGNGNGFTLTSNSLAYDPITKEMSSSGIYSGGSKKTISIKREQYESIEKLLIEAIANKNIHLKNRPKGSGMIKSPSEKVVIRNGDEKNKIEAELRALLKN